VSRVFSGRWSRPENYGPRNREYGSQLLDFGVPVLLCRGSGSSKCGLNPPDRCSLEPESQHRMTVKMGQHRPADVNLGHVPGKGEALQLNELFLLDLDQKTAFAQADRGVFILRQLHESGYRGDDPGI